MLLNVIFVSLTLIPVKSIGDTTTTWARQNWTRSREYPSCDQGYLRSLLGTVCGNHQNSHVFLSPVPKQREKFPVEMFWLLNKHNKHGEVKTSGLCMNILDWLKMF